MPSLAWLLKISTVLIFYNILIRIQNSWAYGTVSLTWNFLQIFIGIVKVRKSRGQPIHQLGIGFWWLRWPLLKYQCMYGDWALFVRIYEHLINHAWACLLSTGSELFHTYVSSGTLQYLPEYSVTRCNLYIRFRLNNLEIQRVGSKKLYNLWPAAFECANERIIVNN